MLKTRLSMAVALVAGTLAVSSCESGDTVVAVNYGFDDATAMDVHMNVAKLHITIKAGGQVETDVDIMRDSDGGITSAAYKRVTANGLSGKATVTIVARDSSGTELMTAENAANAPVFVVEHNVTAAFVTFSKVVTTPDAGMELDADSSGTGGATSTGGSSGTGGATGTGGSGSGGNGSGGSGSGGA